MWAWQPSSLNQCGIVLQHFSFMYGFCLTFTANLSKKIQTKNLKIFFKFFFFFKLVFGVRKTWVLPFSEDGGGVNPRKKSLGHKKKRQLVISGNFYSRIPKQIHYLFVFRHNNHKKKQIVYIFKVCIKIFTCFHTEINGNHFQHIIKGKGIIFMFFHNITHTFNTHVFFWTTNNF